jgi:hypothetical protein
MLTTLPPLHAQLTLRDVEGRTWRSRVEAVDPYAITVARPFDLPLEDGPVAGATLEVSWASVGGRFSLPARLVETVREEAVARWVVTPQGETTRAERRAHFRLPLDGEVSVTVAGQTGVRGEAERPVTGHLVDVTEAALRLRVTRADAERLADGTKVATVFEIRQSRFEAGGTVLRSFASEQANGDAATDVVLVLDLSEPRARGLRRMLMAEQARSRRLARD